MRYALISIGTRGDVQPFIALAIGLQEAGHQPVVITLENFRTTVEAYGVEFYGLPGNMEALLYSQEGQRVLKSGNIFSALRYMQKGGRNIQKQVNPVALQACAGADVLISSELARAQVFSIAERLGKKMAVIELSLPLHPTSEYPFAGLDYLNFPAYNRWTYKFIQSVFWHLNKRDVQDFRRTLGLAPLQQALSKTFQERAVLTLYAVSPSLLIRPRDWGRHLQVTGYLFVSPSKRKEEPPPGLVEWLAAGDRPVYIGFGSMPVPDPELLAEILAYLLVHTGYRIVFCEGWTDMPTLPGHPRFFSTKYVNHDWLLPRCSAAVIHGGAGTVAAVMKAAIPAVVVSIFGDQPWWGKVVKNKGLGTHIPFRKMNALLLERALDFCHTGTVRRNALEMGEHIQREDGLGVTVEALQRYFSPE